jgi:hypothetical protein
MHRAVTLYASRSELTGNTAHVVLMHKMAYWTEGLSEIRNTNIRPDVSIPTKENVA